MIVTIQPTLFSSPTVDIGRKVKSDCRSSAIITTSHFTYWVSNAEFTNSVPYLPNHLSLLVHGNCTKISATRCLLCRHTGAINHCAQCRWGEQTGYPLSKPWRWLWLRFQFSCTLHLGRYVDIQWDNSISTVHFRGGQRQMKSWFCAVTCPRSWIACPAWFCLWSRYAKFTFLTFT